MKKILMVIPKKDFRDEELLTPLNIFKNKQIGVLVVSSSSGRANGMLGSTFEIDKSIDDVDANDFDAIVFVGGAGATEYWENLKVQRMAKEMFISNKIVAAICISPVILANAGVLKGKKATVSASESSLLENKGAIYTGKMVEVDENIITASGPKAAADFAEEIIKQLKIKR